MNLDTTQRMPSRRPNKVAARPRLHHRALVLGIGLALGSLLAVTTPAQAQVPPPISAIETPTGGKITGGKGSITQDGANTIINQQTQLLSLDWQTFNVGKDASVLFKQPSFTAVALNRILDQNPSQIFGKVSSNGQIFLINTHGIIFGASAQLNVGGLVASTLDLTPENFLEKNFNMDAHGGHAGIVNHGIIAAASGGSVTLLGGHVVNNGLILARYGRVNIDGADKAVLDFDGSGRFHVEITGELKQRLENQQAAVVNKGVIRADGGTVILKASATEDLFSNLVNNSGEIQAGAIHSEGGVVRLVASGGNVINSGAINVSGIRGGSVEVLSDHDVMLNAGTNINASGTQGGGRVRIGGGYQGGEGLQHAQRTYVDADATVRADASRIGDGGSVVVWSDANTVSAGQLSARGGQLGGDGGLVETSSHGDLTINRAADVSAAHGAAGTWLLDPNDIDIVAGSGFVNINAASPFQSTGDSAQLGVDLIVAALGSGSNVLVKTTSSGGNSQSGNITLSTTLDYNGIGNSQLTLDAANNILLNGAILDSVGASSDFLGLVLSAGGAVDFGNNINVNSLTVTSAGNITQSAGNLVVANAATLDAGSGDISLTSAGNDFQGAVNLSGAATQIVDTNNLDLGTLNTGTLSASSDGTLDLGSGSIGGNLSATSGNAAITQTGGLTVSGTSTLDAGTSSVSLAKSGNDFQGGVAVTGTGIGLRDSNDLAITTLTNGSNGDVSLIAGGLLSGVSSINAGSGDITLAANGGALNLSVLSGNDISITGANGVTLGGNLTATGNLALASSNAAISQTAGVITVDGTSTVNAGSGAVTLNSVGNDFRDAVNLTGGTTQLADSNNLTLGNLATGGLTVTSGGALNLGSGSIGGNLTATSSNVAISQTGGLTVSGTSVLNAGSGSVTLDNSGNDFQGSVDVSGTGISLRTANNLNMAGLTSGSNGDISLIAGGNLTGISAINAGSGNITLAAFGGSLTLAALSGGDISVTGANGITLGDNVVSAGTLDLTSTDTAITQTGGSITANGATTVNAGSGAVTLTAVGNDFLDVVDLAGGSTQIVDANDLTLGNLATGALSVTSNGALDLGGGNVGGALIAISNGNPISQTAALTIAGTSNLDAGAGAITLDDSGNDFQGNVSVTGAGIALRDANSLGIASLVNNANGDVSLIAGSQLTGINTLNTGTGDITLAALGGALSLMQLSGNNISVTAANGITLGDSVNAAGNLSLTSSNAAIAQSSGALSVLGSTSVDAGTGAVTLTGSGNDFQSTVNLAGGSVQLTDANSLSLGTLDTGNLSVASTGALNLGTGSVNGTLTATSHDFAITQSGGLSVSGVASVDAGTGSITLTDNANDFQDALSLSAAAAQIIDANDLSLGNLAVDSLSVTSHGGLNLGQGNVSGPLSAISNNGNISQTDQLVIGGTSTLDSGTGSITLANTGNDFQGNVSASGAGISLRDANDLAITSLTDNANGDVSLIAGGQLTGITAFNAGSGDLTLAALGGALNLTGLSGGNISLTGANGITLNDDVNASGNLSLTSSNAAITQAAGDISVAGLGAVNAGTGTITLAGVNNDFQDAVSLSGGTTQIADVNDLTLGTLATGALTASSGGALNLGKGNVNGTLSATSGGAITQSSGAGDSLLISGASTLDAGNASITLANTGNDFQGNVTVSGNGISLYDANDLGIASLSNLGNGSVSLIAGGRLLGVTTLDAGTGNITLAALGGSLDLANVSGGNVVLTGANGITLGGNVSAAGTLSLTSTNAAISQTAGRINAAGETQVNAGTGAITLTGSNNDFQDAVSLSGAATQITDANTLTLGSLATGSLIVASTGALNLGNGSVNGSLTASSNGGAITQTGALSVTGLSDLSAGAGNIALSDDGNDFQSSVSASANGIAIHDANDLAVSNLMDGGNADVELVADGNLTTAGAIDAGSGAITLAANGGSLNTARLSGGDISLTGRDGITLTDNVSAQGTLDMASTNAAIQQAGGMLAVTGASSVNAGSGAITLANGSNDFQGALSLTGGTSNIVDVNALALGTLNTGDLTVASSGDLSLGGGTVTGTLTADSHGGNISQSGGLTVTGISSLQAGTGSITLANGGNDFQAAVNLVGQAVQLVDSNALTLGTLDVAALSVTSHGDLNLGSGQVGGTLAANSHGGNISQSGPLIVAGSSTLDSGAGAIALTDAGNDFQDEVSASGTGVAIHDVNDLVIAGIHDSGNGAVELIAEGTLTVPGAINAGSGAITLASKGGSLTTATLNGGDIDLTGRDGITLGGDVTAQGAFTLTSTDAAINQADATQLVIAGPTQVNAGHADISLNQGGNDFQGAVSLLGKNVLLTDRNALQFDAVNVASLTVASGGAITQTAAGSMLVTGPTSLDAGNADITLGNVSNDFQGLVNLSAGNARITDANELTLGTVATDDLTVVSTGKLDLGSGSVDGSLKATSNGGAITQTGPLTVTGTSTLNAGTGNITLDDSGNDFQNTVNLTGGDTRIIDANDLALGTLATAALTANNSGALNLGSGSVGGALNANSHGGAISQTGALAVTGTSTLDAGGAAITLDTVGNDFQDAVSASGNGVSLRDANDLTLAGISSDGDVSVITGGDLLVAAAATAGSGAMSLNAAGLLTVNGNLSAGPITLAGHGIALNANVGADGTLSLASTDAITQDVQNSVITANELTGQSTHATSLNGANLITTLGNFSADGFALSNTQTLTVTSGSVVDGGSRTSLTTSGDGSDLVINGSLKGQQMQLVSSSAISEGSDGSLTAGVLSGSAAKAAQLTSDTNAITALGDFSAHGLSLNNSQTLTVLADHTVDGGAQVNMAITGGGLNIDGTLKGDNVDLGVSGDILEATTGVLDAGLLVGHSDGSTRLLGSNLIDSLGNFSAQGFSLVNAQTLLLAAGSVVDGHTDTSLTTTSGDLLLDGALNGQQMALTSAGAITQGADGVLTASNLTGSSATDTALDGANQITSLGAFQARKLILNNSGALTVNGPVSASDALTLSSGGDLTLAGNVSGTSVDLAAHGNMAINATLDSGAGTITLTQTGTGAVTEGSNGRIVAGTLTGDVEGATTLGSASQYNDNRITTLGGFTSKGGFSLTNGQTLTLASVNDSTFTVDAGSADMYLEVRGGDLLQDGMQWAYNGHGTWSATGKIGLAWAPIYVKAFDTQTVAAVGEPPAWFFGYTPNGQLLPIIGAGINLPAVLLSVQSQSINESEQRSKTRAPQSITPWSYHVKSPGVRVPSDQVECPAQSLSDWCPQGGN